MNFRPAVLVIVFKFAEQGIPDLDSGAIVQCVVINRYVDSRHERFVKVTDAVGC